MDTTAIPSSLALIFSGPGGVFFVAAIGVAAIFATHYLRMTKLPTGKRRSPKTYRHVVIAPYSADTGKDPANAMMPKFSTRPGKPAAREGFHG